MEKYIRKIPKKIAEIYITQKWCQICEGSDFGERDLSYTSVPLIHPTLKLDPHTSLLSDHLN